MNIGPCAEVGGKYVDYRWPWQKRVWQVIAVRIVVPYITICVTIFRTCAFSTLLWLAA